jgi:RNA-binding protein YlmH
MGERIMGRDLLESRIDDAIAKAERGSVARLSFLTPRERRQAERLLRARGAWEQAWFFGGYPTAERACLFLLPEYMTAMLSAPPADCPEEEPAELLAEELAEAVCAVRIKGSGYRTLSHRDYLGSVLGLGLERDALGDIAVQNEHEAVIFCPNTIAGFLCESLSKVASDTVRCMLWRLDESFTDGRRYQPVSDTVASPRLDCVVAALTNLSREEAQTAVRTGLVEVEFEPVERVDLTLEPPVTLSVRGYGRFILRSFDGETRKGRLRMRADKLI